MKRALLLVLLGIACVQALDEPVFESKAPSVRLRMAASSEALYLVWVDNLSPHALTAYRIFAPTPEGYRFVTGGQNTAANPSAGPGRSFEIGYFKREQAKLVVEAALFSDHSYQGNPEQAAIMATVQVGERIRLEQMREFIPKILDLPNATDADKVALVVKEVKAMGTQPNSEMLSRAQRDFPDLPITEELGMRELKSGLQIERDQMAQAFERFATEGAGRTLEQWWKYVNSHYE